MCVCERGYKTNNNNTNSLNIQIDPSCLVGRIDFQNILDIKSMDDCCLGTEGNIWGGIFGKGGGVLNN